MFFILLNIFVVVVKAGKDPAQPGGLHVLHLHHGHRHRQEPHHHQEQRAQGKQSIIGWADYQEQRAQGKQSNSVGRLPGAACTR